MAKHPSSAKTAAGKIFVLLAFFIPILIIIYMPFIPGSAKIDPSERLMVAELGGNLIQIDKSSLETFDRLFVQTGIVKGTKNFIGAKWQIGKLRLMTKLEEVRTRWIDGFWWTIFKAIWRVHALAHMMLLIGVCLCLPAVLDGALISRRRQYQFKGVSRVQYFSSVILFATVAGLLISLPFWPIPLSFYFIVAMMPVAAFSSWLFAANLRAWR